MWPNGPEKAVYYQQLSKQQTHQHRGAGSLAHMPRGATQWAQVAAVHTVARTKAEEPGAKGSAPLQQSVNKPILLPWEQGQAITKWSRCGPHVVWQQRFLIDCVTIEMIQSQEDIYALHFSSVGKHVQGCVVDCLSQ